LKTFNIYSLSDICEDSPVYDAYNGFLIAASSEEEAREIANVRPGDEGSIWTDPAIVEPGLEIYAIDGEEINVKSQKKSLSNT
jgi:hypothetical protein